MRRVLDMAVESDVLYFKDILLSVSRSSLYDVVLPQLDELNREMQADLGDPDIYLLRADYKLNEVTGRYALIMHRHRKVKIIRRERDFLIEVVTRTNEHQEQTETAAAEQ